MLLLQMIPVLQAFRRAFAAPISAISLLLGTALCLGWQPAFAQAQDSTAVTYIYVDSIIIKGNKKTRPAWIVREFEFRVGDSLALPQLGATLERNQLRLMNTGLFNSVKINLKNWDDNNHLSLEVTVVESWYIYPIPVFSLADRNLNVWWNEFDHSLQRVNLGLNLYHFNLTGRNDVAKVAAQFGYSQKYEVTYSLPGINRRQTLGFEAGFLLNRLREVAYATDGNKLLFYYNINGFQSQRRRWDLSLVWRPKLYTAHRFSLERHDNIISDTIAQVLNPDFFLESNTHQRHWSAVFSVDCDRRDIRPYPLHGWYGMVEFRKNGLLPSDDLHLWRVLGKLDKYFSFSSKWSLETGLRGRVSLPRKKVPYFNNKALGYDSEFVRGYEYYVADGIDFGLVKTAVHWQLINRAFDLGEYMPLQSFKIFPLKVYLAINNDLGYANDPYYSNRNPLTNRLLWGYGLGLDVVAYYNKVAQLEWSINDLGQSGFFLHIRSSF